MFVEKVDVGFFIDDLGYGVCDFLVFLVCPLGLYGEFFLGLFKVELEFFDGGVEGVDLCEEGVASGEEGSEGEDGDEDDDDEEDGVDERWDKEEGD